MPRHSCMGCAAARVFDIPRLTCFLEKRARALLGLSLLRCTDTPACVFCSCSFNLLCAPCAQGTQIFLSCMFTQKAASASAEVLRYSKGRRGCESAAGARGHHVHAHCTDQPAGARRRGALPHGLPAQHGARRARAQDVQVARQRHRPAARHRGHLAAGARLRSPGTACEPAWQAFAFCLQGGLARAWLPCCRGTPIKACNFC